MTVSIVRPSIIGAAFRDPCPGWIEGISGASAVFLLGGTGVIRFI
jgi:glycerone phosphate O-acyltransferase/fatty acyl-CoA reductase